MRKKTGKRVGKGGPVSKWTLTRAACASKKGITLLEIMVVVALIGILVGIAVPSYRAVVPRYQVQSAASELVGAMHLGRMRAISTGRMFYMDFNHNGNGIKESYYVCHLDDDGDAAATAGEVSASHISPNGYVEGMGVIRLPRSVKYGSDGATAAANSEAIGTGVAVTVGGSSQITFRPDGRIVLNDGGTQPTIYLQSSRGHNRAVQVNALGRVRVLEWSDGGWS